MPTQLTAHGVTKAYNGHVVLNGASCAVSSGERVGLIGENGSGKSTLLRLFAGVEQPDEGSIIVTADGGVGYLPQDAPLPGHLTISGVIDEALADLRAIEARMRTLEPLLAAERERDLSEYGTLAAVFELRGGYEADARVEQALHGLGLSGLRRDRRIETLSGGERVRLVLASVLASGPEVLLLDEPTNHLDDDALTWLEEHLRARRGTTLAVSHDRVFLDRFAISLIEVDADRGTLTRYGDGYAGYLAEQAAARQRWQQAHDQWNAEMARLAEAAESTARRVAHDRPMRDGNKMAYGRHANRVQQSISSRVSNARQRLARLEDRPVPAPPKPLRFAPSLRAAGTAAPFVEATAIAVAGRLSPVSIALGPGERLLLTGPNGAGKSTILQVLAGDLTPDGGRVALRGRLAHLPQDAAEDRVDEPVFASFLRGRPGPPRQHLERLMSLGLFTRAQLRVAVGQLSVGQRRRLALARALCEPADLLLLDEPTNHLSLTLVEELEAALESFPGMLVVASHDRRFRERWRGACLALPMPGGFCDGSVPIS